MRNPHFEMRRLFPWWSRGTCQTDTILGTINSDTDCKLTHAIGHKNKQKIILKILMSYTSQKIYFIKYDETNNN